MTNHEAKQILLLYRPGTRDDLDPEVQAALALAEQQPELGEWLAQQQAFTSLVREKFRAIQAPDATRLRILAQAPAQILHPVRWWHRPVVLALAASVVLVLTAFGLWMTTPRRHDTLASYRARMAKTALRNYRMDLLTNKLPQIEQFLASNREYSGYVLADKLKQLPPLGCARLRWNNHPVSLICFDRGNQKLLWFFVIDHSALADPPRNAQPEFARVGQLMTACWTRAGKTYLLAVEGNEKLLATYLDRNG